MRIKTFIPLLCLISLVHCGAGRSHPIAEKGVIDLRSWDFEGQGPVELNGEWEFSWMKFIPPARAAENAKDISGFIKVPGLWNGNSFNGRKISGHGYGTYRLRILLNKKARAMAFMVRDVGTSYVMYLNGTPLCRGGRIGTNEPESKPGYRPGIYDFSSDTAEIDLVIHVANFHHKNGGLWEQIRFGLESDLRMMRENRIAFGLFLFGSIIIMGLYHLGLFAFNTRDRSPLYFGVVCFLFAVRIFVTGEYFFLRIVPRASWELVLKVEYLSFYLGVIFFVKFLHSLFRDRFSITFLRVFLAIGLSLCAAVLITPSRIYSYTVQAYEALTLIACLYSIYVIIASLRMKRGDAKAFLPGFLLLFAMVINDILHHNLVITTEYLVPFGLFLFILFQGFLHALRFSRTIREHTEARFKLLQERISPHFLFNSLNTVHAMIRKNAEAADNAVLKLAHNYRFLMDRSLASAIPFDEEWRFTMNYLDLEKLRFGESLSYEMAKEGDFGDIEIPPLTIQPVVENSIKHGLRNSEGGGFVRIIALREGNSVAVTVTDNGAGLKSDDLFSRSLGNILSRLQYRFDKADLAIDNRQEGGASVRIAFTVKKHKAGLKGMRKGKKNNGG